MSNGGRVKQYAKVWVPAKIMFYSHSQIEIFGSATVPPAKFLDKSFSEDTKCSGNIVHNIKFT